MEGCKLNRWKPKWFIRMYAKDGDRLLSEQPLDLDDPSVLQRLFNEPAENPMYDCYPITEAQLPEIHRIAGRSIDLRLGDYFVECEQAFEE